jgi:hypothetical protein
MILYGNEPEGALRWSYAAIAAAFAEGCCPDGHRLTPYAGPDRWRGGLCTPCGVVIEQIPRTGEGTSSIPRTGEGTSFCSGYIINSATAMRPSALHQLAYMGLEDEP